MNFEVGILTPCCWQNRQSKFFKKESPTLTCNWNVISVLNIKQVKDM